MQTLLRWVRDLPWLRSEIESRRLQARRVQVEQGSARAPAEEADFRVFVTEEPNLAPTSLRVASFGQELADFPALHLGSFIRDYESGDARALRESVVVVVIYPNLEHVQFQHVAQLNTTMMETTDWREGVVYLEHGTCWSGLHSQSQRRGD